MQQRGVLSHVDAVGVHAFPSSSEYRWRGWEQEISDVQKCLARLGVNPQIWITQSGFSTWRGDEQAQVRAFADAMNAPVDRVYWQEMFDKPAVAGVRTRSIPTNAIITMAYSGRFESRNCYSGSGLKAG